MLLDHKEIRQMNGVTRELTIGDLDLFVCFKQGKEVDEDCSCDSSFMIKYGNS